MWSLFLCRHCYAWVMPIDGHCPECLSKLNPSEPDPTIDELGVVLGDLRQSLGYFRVLRASYDYPGTLYLLSQGLFFVPHVVEEERELVSTSASRSQLRKVCDALLPKWNVRISKRHRETKRETCVQVFRPQLLLPEDRPLLPRLLMDHPGAFFIPVRSIRALDRVRGSWWIERLRGSIRLVPDSEPIDQEQAWCFLKQDPQWKMLLLR